MPRQEDAAQKEDLADALDQAAESGGQIEQKPVGYFPDGYTREALWRPDAGESLPLVRFVYEPLGAKELAVLRRAMNRAGVDPVSQNDALFILFQKRLKSWDLTKPDGSRVDWRNRAEFDHVAPQIIAGLTELILDNAEISEADRKN